MRRLKIVVNQTALLLLPELEVVAFQLGDNVQVLFIHLSSGCQIVGTLLLVHKLRLGLRCNCIWRTLHSSNLEIMIVLLVAHVTVSDGIRALSL